MRRRKQRSADELGRIIGYLKSRAAQAFRAKLKAEPERASKLRSACLAEYLLLLHGRAIAALNAIKKMRATVDLDEDLIELLARLQPLWLFFDKFIEASRYEAKYNSTRHWPLSRSLARLMEPQWSPSEAPAFRNHELFVLRDLRNAGAHLAQVAGGRATSSKMVTDCIVSHLKSSAYSPFEIRFCQDCKRTWTVSEILGMARIRIQHLTPDVEKSALFFESEEWAEYEPLWERFTAWGISRPHHPNIFTLHAIGKTVQWRP